MKRLFLLLTAILTLTVSTVSYAYAGEWKQDARGYWYQNDDGSFQTGWFQDGDGKWYYLDLQSGYMLANTMTPDGYFLSADGSWTGEAAAYTGFDGETYDHKAQLTVTAYSTGPAGVEVLEYPLPVTIYFNHTYENVYGGTITPQTFYVKDGVAYASYHVDTDGGCYELLADCRYNFENETHLDSEEILFNYCKSGGIDDSHHLLWRKMYDAEKKRSPLVSAEICIKKGNAPS